jgi:hypothetical protein
MQAASGLDERMFARLSGTRCISAHSSGNEEDRQDMLFSGGCVAAQTRGLGVLPRFPVWGVGWKKTAGEVFGLHPLSSRMIAFAQEIAKLTLTKAPPWGRQMERT